MPHAVRRSIILPFCLGMLLPAAAADHNKKQLKIEWKEWSDGIFEAAKKENRFVLLDLGAVWCHWCHVMEEVTYRDPKVIALINARYIAVRVDQDSRPDLSNRYENYGWPATVVFNTDGSEIVKRQGYIPPKPMTSLLQAIIDDPSPGPSVVAEAPWQPTQDGELASAEREKLRAGLRDAYDPKNHGWGTVHKYLSWDIIEYCMDEADRGDRDFGRLARETLDAQRQLIDPVWGGVYQYSTDGDWKHPHFEKIMQMQAENLRIYSEAYLFWRDPAYLEAAKRIRGYMENFFKSPDGVFYTSQDADLVPGEHSADYFALSDAKRRQRGVPRIDQHIYARENAWAISALCGFFSATGNESALTEATRVAEWIIANRSLAYCGFRHDAVNDAGPYLADSAYMARAFLNLYTATADQKWLKRAEKTARFIEANFKGDAGYLAFVRPLAGKLQPLPQFDENVAIARTMNLLQHYTGNARYRELARHAMRYLSAPSVGENHGFEVAGILLADRELNAPPLHLTIVGRKDAPATRALFRAALTQRAIYKRVEWWDGVAGSLPNPDVEYPQLERAAVFVCTDRSCSPPMFDPVKVSEFRTKRK